MDSVLIPAYNESHDNSRYVPWTGCLKQIERALHQARSLNCGAAIILTPAGPDGNITRVPEYLSFEPARNTAITGVQPTSHSGQ